MKNSENLHYTVCPKLLASVGAGFIEETDIPVLENLAGGRIPQDGTLDSLTRPDVGKAGQREYLIRETCCYYNDEVREKLLANWAEAGASPKLTGIIKAAQNQLCQQILVSDEGMVVETREPVAMAKAGKRRLGKKATQKLLSDLREIYKSYWPIEQLANAVNARLKKCKKIKKNGGAKK